jgi:hypothetical protein
MSTYYAGATIKGSYCRLVLKTNEWALKLRSFSLDIDKQKKELMDMGEYFSEQEIKDYYKKFLEIMDIGDAEYQ